MNWDKLEAEVKKEEKEEKLDGEQALQKLFRDIYGSSDEDTRRAMNKSFQARGASYTTSAYVCAAVLGLMLTSFPQLLNVGLS